MLLKLTRASLWYKLYADDLVLIVNYRQLHNVLNKLRQTVAEFGLILNVSKSAIFFIKGHQKLGVARSIDGIPVFDQYCYLGVLIDNRGSIEPHIRKIQKRSSYLCSCMSYFGRQLSFANQFLLWSTYVQPYYHYVAPSVCTQTQTI
jgi:hypothetical protein